MVVEKLFVLAANLNVLAATIGGAEPACGGGGAEAAFGGWAVGCDKVLIATRGGSETACGGGAAALSGPAALSLKPRPCGALA